MTPKGDPLEMTRDFLIGLAMFAPALWCQTPARPEFEVASVKARLSDDQGSRWNPEHGNFTAENTPLKQLIRLAYQVPASSVSGPGWLDSLRYDINAKGHGDAPESQVMLMLQALLADRFHLQLHRETKETAVYFLVVANGGMKMQSADAPNPSDLAGRPVVDRTGIPGSFRLRLWYTRYTSTSESEGPDIFAAVREQLGLRLEPGRGPVETLIVDRADKVPTEN